MKIGMSSACFYPDLLLEDQIRKIANLSFDVCEVFINTLSETKEDFVKRLNEIAVENNLQVNSIHGFSSWFEPYLFDPYKRRREDMLDYFKSLCKASKILGSNIYTFHGMRLTEFENLNMSLIIDVMKEMYYIAGENDVKIAMENVSWAMSSKTSYLEYLIENSKVPIYFTLDVKQAYRANINPLDYISIMKDRIINLHLNDRDEENSCLLPGVGKVDFHEILKELKKVGYKGNGIIEVYNENFKTDEEVIASKKYMESIVKMANRRVIE